LAKEYAAIADRFRFHLSVAVLPPDVAELVQQAHDALAKASALMRLSEGSRTDKEKPPGYEVERLSSSELSL
jgi:hypothetical protein